MTLRQFLTQRPLGRLLLAAAPALLLAAWLGPKDRPADALDDVAGSSVQAAEPAPRRLPVSAVSARPAEGWSKTGTFSGEVRAARAVELGFEIAGRVAQVRVDEGDPIEAGGLIARLEADRIEARLAAARAALAAEEALLAEDLQGPREQEIAVAAATVKELEAELDLSRLRRDRRVGLLEQDAVPEEELDVARRDFAATEARLAAARALLDQLEEGTRAERVEARRASVARLAAEVSGLEVDLADAELRAPFAGVVARRDIDEGAALDAGTIVVRLVEAAAPEAVVGVPADLAVAMETGAVLRARVAGRNVDARLRAVLPELDPTTRTAGLVLDLAPGSALPGESLSVEIQEPVEADGLAVPVQALVAGERGLWSVFVLEPTAEEGVREVLRRDVEVLHVDGENALVRGTLRSGEDILATGVQRVVPHQEVRLLAAELDR